jgi:hypothetical protein
LALSWQANETCRAGHPVSWKLDEHWALLASAGHTIHEPRGERPALFSYLGLQLLF